ncbi:MAG TPA: hypothetical protein VM240_07975 [Verrucomicrobiae bacterium]|nr:hypothetical protein [Verrucomicrobiae bacterium]
MNRSNALVRSSATTILLAALLLASFAWSVALFGGFVAEDAYILYRYVENVFRHGALIYNPGDRINALTSPLHAGVTTVLYAVTRECLWTGKIAGLLLTCATSAAVAWRYRSDRFLALTALALVALPSSTVLWAFGGLETPWLMMISTLTALALWRRASTCGTYVVLFLSGLGFLARYDAALFFAPLAAAALLREPSWRHRLGAIAAGSSLPLAWLAIAWTYYGDILPTSYYIKPPGLSLGRVLDNAEYIGAWLGFTGLLPIAILAIALRPSTFTARPGALIWPLALGVTLELAYGLSMATTHMMFLFRSFTPYVPAAALVLLELLRRARSGPRPRADVALAAFVALAAPGHAAHAWYTWDRSLNGLSPVGELRRIGVRDWMDDFMVSLWDQAAAIRTDWARRPAASGGALRIGTYAGGIVPYELPEAYVYEALASFRHGEPQYRNFNLHADYCMVITPFFGPLESQLQDQPDRFEQVFERSFVLDGQMQSFRVYYNPRPDGHPLGNRIDRRQPLSAATPVE